MRAPWRSEGGRRGGVGGVAVEVNLFVHDVMTTTVTAMRDDWLTLSCVCVCYFCYFFTNSPYT